MSHEFFPWEHLPSGSTLQPSVAFAIPEFIHFSIVAILGALFFLIVPLFSFIPKPYHKALRVWRYCFEFINSQLELSLIKSLVDVCSTLLDEPKHIALLITSVTPCYFRNCWFVFYDWTNTFITPTNKISTIKWKNFVFFRNWNPASTRQSKSFHLFYCFSSSERMNKSPWFSKGSTILPVTIQISGMCAMKEPPHLKSSIVKYAKFSSRSK